MTTKNFISIARTGFLALSCMAFLASCTTDSEEIDEPVLNMGDPKNTSPQGSRCFELTEFTFQGEDQTATYEEIKWEFKNNGVVIARSPNQEQPGNWNIGFLDGVQKLSLTWEDSLPFLFPIEGIWTVVSLDPDNPQFTRNEDSPNPDVLGFTSSGCSIISTELETLNATIRDSLFVVSNFIFQNNDVTSLYNNVTFDFKENGTVVAERFGQHRTGQFQTGEDQDGLTVSMQFNAPLLPLTYLNATWDVVSFDDTTIALENLSGPPGSETYLIITTSD